MKFLRIFPLVLALLLSGCGARHIAEAPSSSADTEKFPSASSPTLPALPTPPVGTPVPADGIPLECTALKAEAVDLAPEELPEALLTLNEIITVFTDGQPFLISQLPENGIYLYGVISADSEDRMILRVNDRLASYPLTWTTGHGVFPTLYLLDLDTDGEAELLILANTNSGTQCDVWTPTVVELSQEGWPAYTLENVDHAAAMEPYLVSYWEQFPSVIDLALDGAVLSLPLPDYALPEAPENSPTSLSPGIGDLCSYTVEGGAVRASLGVTPHWQLPWSAWVAAELSATLQYQNGGFALVEPALTQLSI